MKKRLVFLWVFLTACHPAQPSSGSRAAASTRAGLDAPGNSAASAEEEPSAGSTAPSASVRARPAPSASTAVEPTPSAVGSARIPAGPESQAASLVDSGGRALPQTEDKPKADSAALGRRVELLFQAIVEDRPELAQPAFFPVIAYREVKAIAQPERDWQLRLMRAFERDTHEYHRQLGRDAGSASLLGLRVPEERARWMKPGSEGNRLGYWRVLRSELRYRDAQGREKGLEVTSLISWRGEWYVVHLHGFK